VGQIWLKPPYAYSIPPNLTVENAMSMLRDGSRDVTKRKEFVEHCDGRSTDSRACPTCAL
jgi:hypothetical protein